VELVVAYLTSYEHMGRAWLSCAAGCSCAPQEVDGHHHERTSVSAIAVLPLAPAPPAAPSTLAGGRAGSGAAGMGRCVLRVEVLPESSSGEFKFKVIQVVARAKEAWAWAGPVGQESAAPGSSNGGGDTQ
jgi:hypothetical protein